MYLPFQKLPWLPCNHHPVGKGLEFRASHEVVQSLHWLSYNDAWCLVATSQYHLRRFRDMSDMRCTYTRKKNEKQDFSTIGMREDGPRHLKLNKSIAGIFAKKWASRSKKLSMSLYRNSTDCWHDMTVHIKVTERNLSQLLKFGSSSLENFKSKMPSRSSQKSSNHLSHEKKQLITFYYTGSLIGILILAYYNLI